MQREPDQDLILKAQAGDVQAQDQLILKNLGFIYQITMRYGGTDGREEYLSHAVEGFIRSIREWKPEGGAKLITYAFRGIAKRVQIARSEDTTIRVPSANQKVPQIIAAKARVAASSLDSEGPNGRTLYGLVKSLPASDDSQFTVELAKTLLARMNEVRPREAFIVTQRCMGRTLKSIAEELGMTKERIRQIEQETLAVIRETMAA